MTSLMTRMRSIYQDHYQMIW